MEKKKRIAGWILTVLVIAPFTMSGIMKLMRPPEVIEGMGKMGLPESILLPLAILEMTCVVIYLVPMTSVLGAILLTGYLGGAILTHLRVGDVFYVQITLGVVIWLGIYLREPRLREILPWRCNQSKTN